MDLLAHVRIFIEIADRGSLASAARARGLVPSAVTGSLRRLEEYLGTRLIARSTRSLALTPEGADFLAHCRRIVHQLDEACDHVARAGPLRGTIRISALNDFGRSRLAALIDAFLARHPGVRIDLHLDDRVVDLIGGGFDLAIRTGPLPDSRLKARLILHGGRSVCAAPDYWRRRGKPARPEELAQHNCLVLSRAGDLQSTWQFRDGRRSLAVAVSGDRMANDGGLLRQWAIAGAGVVLKSDYDVAADLEAGRLETALDDFRPDDVNLYAVHPAGGHLARRVRAFIDHLVAASGASTLATSRRAAAARARRT